MRRHFDHAFDYRLLDFEAEAVDSYLTFGRAIDLFGDGSVRVVSTPGHTRGHMSVLLRLGEGREVLLAADAGYTMENIREGVLPNPLTNHDDHLWQRSVREIQLYMRERPDATVVPSHDLKAVEGLGDVHE